MDGGRRSKGNKIGPITSVGLRILPEHLHRGWEKSVEKVFMGIINSLNQYILRVDTTMIGLITIATVNLSNFSTIIVATHPDDKPG